MINITNLEKTFSPRFTLKIGELHINPGERVALTGPNGSGKSTLLRLAAGILKPDKGEIVLGSTCGCVGYEPQNAYAFKGTVEENIKLAAHKKADIEKILRDCRLYELKDKRTNALSGGEKQRMCFARMLAGKYSLLLLDEPFSAADIETGELLAGLLAAECEKNGTTLLFATHLPAQAYAVCNKVIIMNGGEISEYSDITDLKSPKSEFGKKFTEQWRIP